MMAANLSGVVAEMLYSLVAQANSLLRVFPVVALEIGCPQSDIEAMKRVLQRFGEATLDLAKMVMERVDRD